MTKTFIPAVALFASLCAAPLSAQTPFPAPPAPPAPPAAPTVVAPAPPAAPVAPVPPGAAPFRDDVDFDFDAAAFQHDLDKFHVDLDSWKLDFDQWKADVDLSKVADQLWALQTPTPAPAPPGSSPKAISVFMNGNADNAYEQGRSFIERDQYTRALESFDRVIAGNGTRTDAALYWKAYSLSKVARTADALSTLADLQKRFPKSPWVNDARSLEIEIKQAAGQSVNAEGQTNDEIKLLALQGMLRTDPETALPIVEKMLAGGSSVRVKERALFVVSQSRNARGREVVTNVARGNTNPDLQMAAIRHLGQMGTAESRQALADVYRGSSNVDVKRAILRALRNANAVDELIGISRTEKDSDLRREIIRYLGTTNRAEAAEALRAIYASDTSNDVKREVIRALRSHNGGGKTLVELARKETNLELKTEIVRILTNMNDPAVREYMLELLK